ncbi:MAG TPA: DedA family protein [Coleofasciculaceae cyanobacterium]|jgi:membrane protein DedA with SNARE-associated domain
MEFLHSVLDLVMNFIHTTIDTLQYVGIVILMGIESANIPLPSEFILPYAGFMVQQGKLNFHLAALAGALGCVAGSIPSYWLGYYGGHNFLAKHGKWLLMSTHDLEMAEKWTSKYGDWAFFLCRMLPVVRTFISTPAGVLRARFWPFIFLTFLGSWIWSYGLVYVGVYFGENLAVFKEIWHKFDYAILGILVVLGVWYIWRHAKHIQADQQKLAQQDLIAASSASQDL